MKKNTALHSMLPVICTFSQNRELCANTSTPQRVQKVCVWHPRAAVQLIRIGVSCRTAVVHCVMAVAELFSEMASANIFETGYRLNISPSDYYNTSGLCNTPFWENLRNLLCFGCLGMYFPFFFSLKTEVTVYLQFKLTEFFYPASRNDMDTYK